MRTPLVFPEDPEPKFHDPYAISEYMVAAVLGVSGGRKLAASGNPGSMVQTGQDKHPGIAAAGEMYRPLLSAPKRNTILYESKSFDCRRRTQRPDGPGGTDLWLGIYDGSGRRRDGGTRAQSGLASHDPGLGLEDTAYGWADLAVPPGQAAGQDGRHYADRPGKYRKRRGVDEVGRLRLHPEAG